MDTESNVNVCIRTRQNSAMVIGEVLQNFQAGSEVDLRDRLQEALAAQPSILPEGWYSPPPGGIGVLFSSTTNAARTRFTSFRQESCWPQTSYVLGSETIATIYISPVDATGIIGDLGFSYYVGHDQKVRDHLKNCLEAIETVADHAGSDMSFQELYTYAQAHFKKRNLTHEWITTNLNSSGNSIGHTVPWSYELPSATEAAIITKGNINELKNVISHKRLYVDADETFTIPETAAFTVESQLGSSLDEGLPNTFFHTIVTFTKGKKQVLSNFNPIFDTLGIDYMRSRF